MRASGCVKGGAVELSLGPWRRLVRERRRRVVGRRLPAHRLRAGRKLVPAAPAPPAPDPRRLVTTPEPAVPEPIARPSPFHAVLSGEGSRLSLLRKIVVLKEILEPPVALREQDVWDRI